MRRFREKQLNSSHVKHCRNQWTTNNLEHEAIRTCRRKNKKQKERNEAKVHILQTQITTTVSQFTMHSPSSKFRSVTQFELCQYIF